MSEVPRFRDFRAVVDGIPDSRDKILIQALYLTASRVNEMLTKVIPSHQSRTKPYGKFMKYDFEDFQHGKTTEKVLTLKCAVLKRKVRQRKRRKQEERIYKMIALPVNPKFEPWTLALVRRIKKAGTLAFNMTDGNALYIVKKWFSRSYPDMTTHDLRHFRITHLAQEYDFDAFDLTCISGWTFKTGLAAAGQGMASGQLDVYLHLAWKRYFPKLLKPLP
jgi:hypothetical protein